MIINYSVSLRNMTLFKELSYNKSFAQLAKESNFTFGLFRGRVDWKKLEILDIDRIVRDQDVELLDIHTSNVTNCNLESEYDVKILDPNFIKLFRLAQLLIDFLLHCKRYLEHCIKTAHESVQASNKEVEELRKQLKARKYEVKQLKKKLKEIKQQLVTAQRLHHSNFECSLCGKVFMSEIYLQGHHSRRHVVYPYPLALKHSNHLSHSSKVVEQDDCEITIPEETHSIKKKYEGEIEELKTMFFAEIQKLKQNECINKESNTIIQTKANNGMTISKENIEDSQEIPSKSTSVVEDHRNIKKNLTSSEGTINIPEESVKTSKVEEQEWLRRLEEREGVWRARLSSVDQQYKKQVTELQDRLNTSRLEGQEMKKSLEDRLEEVLAKFEQNHLLLANKNTTPFKDQNIQIENSIKERRTSDTENKSAPKVHMVKNIPQKNIDELPPPPFQKRKAFVSQKSKTIQDEGSFESVSTKELSSNLSKILEPDENDSDSENIPPQNRTKERSENVPEQKRMSSSVEVLGDSSNRSGVNGGSNSKESIITQLLEEERLKSSTNKMFGKESIVAEEEGEESSVSETCTETESDSESSEEKLIDTNIKVKEFKPKPEPLDDHLLLVETQLAEQSLKSMESLLAANPDILCQLREDLTQLCARRLQNLGVDPSWRRLPPATFQTKLAVLTHQRNIMAKNHKVYFTLRDKLSEDADAAVHCQPTQSTADSVLARLRNKATQIINAVKFSHQINLGTLRKKVNKPNSTQLKDPPLASSSPQLSPLPPTSAIVSDQKNIPFVIPKIRSTPPKDSSSLSLSTSEDDDTEKVVAANVTYTKSRASPGGSYKSALRNALSTGNLAKKKVLFVDEAIKENRRSQSVNTVATLDSSINQSDKVSSVANLVNEIQFQLSQRSGKLPHSVDLMKPQDTLSSSSTGMFSDLPLSQILPLTKSGRELLESQERFNSNIAASSTQSSLPTLSPLKGSPNNGSENNALQPVSNRNLLAPLGKNSEFHESPRELKKTSSNPLLEPLKVSPVHSLTSIGSSLLDVSVSPRGTQGSLEWDLQDLEDNLRE